MYIFCLKDHAHAIDNTRISFYGLIESLLKPGCQGLSVDFHVPFPFEHKLYYNLRQFWIAYYQWCKCFQHHIFCCLLTTWHLKKRLQVYAINGTAQNTNTTRRQQDFRKLPISSCLDPVTI